MMYRDILTIVLWSIKEVNRNLSDRKPISEFSIKYLKNFCSTLARMIGRQAESMPGEAGGCGQGGGAKKSFTLKEVSEMLYDPRELWG